MSAYPNWVGADGKIHRYYLKTTPVTYFDSDSALGHGVVAVKRELKYNGFSVPQFNTENYLIGLQAEQTIKLFQDAAGLEVDGVAGPNTCKALFKKRIVAVQESKGIPDDLLGKQLQLESLFDPSARGTLDPRDRGLAQINSGAHPEISDDQADDPQFAVNWAGDYLVQQIEATGDVDGGLAAYNVGVYYATKWVKAGKPRSALYTTNGKDYAIMCTVYVSLVRGQAWSSK